MTEALLFVASMIFVFGLALGITSGWNIAVVIWLVVGLGFILSALFEQLKTWK